MHQSVFCRAGDLAINTTAGVVAELRNILVQEKITGRGACRCRFDRRFGKKKVIVGDATQGCVVLCVHLTAASGVEVGVLTARG